MYNLRTRQQSLLVSTVSQMGMDNRVLYFDVIKQDKLKNFVLTNVYLPPFFILITPFLLYRITKKVFALRWGSKNIKILVYSYVCEVTIKENMAQIC